MTISSFSGYHRFLSNFYRSPFIADGYTWETVEHFFQAMKTYDAAERAMIVRAPTPGDAKRLGRRVTLRPNWEEVKDTVMSVGLMYKFAEGSELAEQLIATHPHELIEGNRWGDRYWGQCPVGNGKNMLGILLMERRYELMGE
jgi:ribA/ribD-fused uncharacterized protein